MEINDLVLYLLSKFKSPHLEFQELRIQLNYDPTSLPVFLEFSRLLLVILCKLLVHTEEVCDTSAFQNFLLRIPITFKLNRINFLQ